MSTNALLHDYLCHCYLYYGLDKSIISDHEFDDLCKAINLHWDELHGPWKLFLVENGEVKGKVKGLHMLPDDYPEKIRSRATEMLQDYEDIRKSFG